MRKKIIGIILSLIVVNLFMLTTIGTARPPHELILFEQGNLALSNLHYPNEIICGKNFNVSGVITYRTTITSHIPSTMNLHLKLEIGGCTKEEFITINSVNRSMDIPFSIDCIPKTIGNINGSLQVNAGLDEYKSGDNSQTISTEVYVLDLDTPSEITIGDEDQENGEYVEEVFTIKNNGTKELSINITHNIDSEYKPEINITHFTLASGEEKNIKLKIYIPSDFFGEDKIGDLTVKGVYNGESIEKKIEVNAKARGLEIEDMDIYIEGDHEDIDNGEEVEAQPGDNIELEIEVKNDIEDDLEISTSIENDDFDLDKEKSKNMDEGDSYRFSFNFTIPYDIKEDTYEIEIKVKGENDHTYKTDAKIKIKIDKEKHRLRIQYLDADNTYCNNYLHINTKIWNTGEEDEENVRVVIKIPSLNIVREEKNINIDERESITRTYSIYLNKDIKQDYYIVEEFVYYDYDEYSDYKSEKIYVKCQEEYISEEENEGDNEEDKTESNIIITKTGEEWTPTTTLISGVEDERNTIIYLSIGVVVLIGILSFLIARM